VEYARRWTEAWNTRVVVGSDLPNGIIVGWQAGQQVRASRPGTLEKSFAFRVRRDASATSAEVAMRRSIVEILLEPRSCARRRES